MVLFQFVDIGLISASQQRIDSIIVVTVLRRTVNQPLTQLLMSQAVEVIRQCGSQLLLTNRALFKHQFLHCRQAVASGNQYYQLISFFPELKDEISFVAENGALVYEHGKQLFHGELTRHESRIVIGELLKDKQLNFVACGLQSAYVSENAPEAFVALMAKHYHRLKPVKDYQEIDDVLFKFSLNLPDEQIPLVIDKLHVALDGIMKPVTSGFGFIDLIIPGLHKANGISRLLKRWDLSPQNVVAIGDSGNDAEMLKMARYSFAMGNAAENIKQIARYATDDNNHEGALNVIQAVLDNTSPFNS